MLNIREAMNIVKKNHPGGSIQTYVEYRNLYLFQVFNKLPGEEEMDPFFSVDKETGEFKEFSILTDATPNEIIPLFVKEKQRR